MRDADEYDDQDDEDDFRPSQRRRPTKGRVNDSLPVFVIIIAVMECVLVLLKLIIVGMSLIALSNRAAFDPTLYNFSIMQFIIDSILIVLMIGTVIGYFSKQAWGHHLSWGTVVATVFSMGIAFATFVMTIDITLKQIQGLGGNDAARTGAWVGAVLTFGIRVIYLAAYSFASLQFTQFIKKRRGANSHGE